MSNKINQPELLTTFRTLVVAQKISHARWPQEFIGLYKQAKKDNLAFVVVGQGSNILFLEDFIGHIVVNDYKGIKVTQDKEAYYVTANSAVTVDELIDYCHRFKIFGLENLSLIPSSMGTAVVSNIGAYGVEIKDFVFQVEVLNLETEEVFKLNNSECNFSYRDSIFKQELSKGYVVLSVTLKLNKNYNPVLSYYPLTTINPEQVDAKEIRKLINQTRQQKLPDFNHNGNGGSFFVNPIVSTAHFESLKQEYPNLVSYPAGEGSIKLSAGWLIEQAGLKGFQHKNAQVSPMHALVLCNKEQKATAQEIAELATLVQKKVLAKFKILLTPEIRFYDSHGEVNGTQYLKNLQSKLTELD